MPPGGCVSRTCRPAALGRSRRVRSAPSPFGHRHPVATRGDRAAQAPAAGGQRVPASHHRRRERRLAQSVVGRGALVHRDSAGNPAVAAAQSRHGRPHPDHARGQRHLGGRGEQPVQQHPDRWRVGQRLLRPQPRHRHAPAARSAPAQSRWTPCRSSRSMRHRMTCGSATSPVAASTPSPAPAAIVSRAPRLPSTRARRLPERTDREHAADFSNWQYGASLGGPIVKDKVLFFAAGELRERRAPFVGPIIGSPADAGISVDSVNRFVSILQGYGLDPGSYGGYTTSNRAATSSEADGAAGAIRGARGVAQLCQRLDPGHARAAEDRRRGLSAHLGGVPAGVDPVERSPPVDGGLHEPYRERVSRHGLARR